ncbi:MAG TPA: S4 domain-containing protein, partial [Steroidobacteraceae bacterium]|nr:S4 domain-containing protein [Steroidobacteraceae bacterium]
MTRHMTPEFREHTLTLPSSPAGQRLDQALALALPQYSRSRLAGWIKDGAVSLDGRPPRGRDLVYGGERVLLRAAVVADESVLPQ